MNINQRMLSILRKKIRWNHNHKELCGCFSYAEIVILADYHKVSMDDYQWSWVDYAREHMEKGENGSTWFYFHPREDLLPSQKTHHKV